METSNARTRPVPRMLAFFGFAILLSLALLFVIRLPGFAWVFFGLIPALVIVIYLLPGHGERDSRPQSPSVQPRERPPTP